MIFDMKIRSSLCALSLLCFVSASSLAANGPRGGPSFGHYEWTEVLSTDLGANAFLPVPLPFWPGVNHWEPRAGLEAVELNNRLFVIGGRTPIPNLAFASIIHGDVWSSDDLGKTWGKILDDPVDQLFWPNRAYHEVIAAGHYMYLLGGQNFNPIPPSSGCTEFSTFSMTCGEQKTGRSGRGLPGRTAQTGPHDLATAVKWWPITLSASVATAPLATPPMFM